MTPEEKAAWEVKDRRVGAWAAVSTVLVLIFLGVAVGPLFERETVLGWLLLPVLMFVFVPIYFGFRKLFGMVR